MGIVDAILLGVLEGLTEFLPVSSTGHLILLSELLKHQGEGAKSFDIIIQLGAIVAVAVYFRERVREMFRGLVNRSGDGLALLLALMAAFVPTAVAGLLLHRIVKAKLFGPIPVAGALIVGGVIMMAVERWHRGRVPESDGLADVTISKGFIIGLCQCLALWPGSSRSMTTIVGGQLCGLSTKTAAEFSFLLALPTLGAATVYDFYKNGAHVLAMPSGGTNLAVGLVVSFIVAWAVVAVFLRYVTRVGMTPFGIYRIVLGAAVLLWA
jgi:undecaprenyl-diphosphatase